MSNSISISISGKEEKKNPLPLADNLDKLPALAVRCYDGCIILALHASKRDKITGIVMKKSEGITEYSVGYTFCPDISIYDIYQGPETFAISSLL